MPKPADNPTLAHIPFGKQFVFMEGLAILVEYQDYH